ncbi:MAG: LysM peptidoglycan-binding domain-containing protein, partial [Pseudomonadota bacterium]
ATAGSLGLAQFQAQIDIPDDPNFQLDRLFVIVSDEGGGGGTPPRVFVPVLYGPRILSGYFGYVPHTVAAGETLSSISNQYYETSSQVSVIQRANAHIIDDPNLIFPGQILRIPRN